MTPHPQRLAFKQYAVSLLLVVAATLLTLAISPLFDGKTPMFIFVIAVILSAAYGGVGTGLFATTVSAGIALSLLQDRVFILVLAHSTVALFAVVSIAISIVVGKLRALNADLTQARDRLQAANDELERANKKLSHHTEALSRSNQELQQFAHALAHDLRNPLRSIGALTDLLTRNNADQFDESSKECGRMIVEGVQRMESMIVSLLDYAAAVSSQEDYAAIDCNAVMERVLLDLRHAIETSGAVVKFDPLPAVQMGESHLVQVLLNLVSNAVKYRGSQKPEVHISAKDEGSDWIFNVTDNGIGFDMKEAHGIFAMFKRLHSSERYEGNGVGLALCKVVIQRYHGRIWAESELGRGSTFFFTIPKMQEGSLPRKSVTVEQPQALAKKAGN